MSVIPLTVFFSLLLVGGFVVLFVREQRRRHLAGAERDSLLPLADEIPRLVPIVGSEQEHPGHDDADHDHVADHDHHHHGQGRCGCRDGTRPPCTGCLRRARTDDLSVPPANR